MKKFIIATFLFSLYGVNGNAQEVTIYEQNGKMMGMATYSNAQPDERGKMPKPKTFKKETGIVNGMKVIEYGGINWLFETTAKNDYAGIQGFPQVSGGVKLEGTVNLPDAVIICIFFSIASIDLVLLRLSGSLFTTNIVLIFEN